MINRETHAIPFFKSERENNRNKSLNKYILVNESKRADIWKEKEVTEICFFFFYIRNIRRVVFKCWRNDNRIFSFLQPRDRYSFDINLIRWHADDNRNEILGRIPSVFVIFLFIFDIWTTPVYIKKYKFYTIAFFSCTRSRFHRPLVPVVNGIRLRLEKNG